jgi:hypothetical protein
MELSKKWMVNGDSTQLTVESSPRESVVTPGPNTPGTSRVPGYNILNRTKLSTDTTAYRYEMKNGVMNVLSAATGTLLCPNFKL